MWEISTPTLLSLGYSVKIGDVQPSCGKFSSSPIECTVNSNLFSYPDAYQIHINSYKVRWNRTLDFHSSHIAKEE